MTKPRICNGYINMLCSAIIAVVALGWAAPVLYAQVTISSDPSNIAPWQIDDMIKQLPKPGTAEAATARRRDRAITQRREERRYHWFLTQTLAAYLKVGDRNPKWDAEAEKTLRLFSKIESRPAFDYRNAFCGMGLTRQRLKLAYDAITALHEGCRDPLITIIADDSPFNKQGVRLWPVTRPVPTDVNAILNSRYPAAIRLRLLTATVRRCDDEGAWKAGAQLVNAHIGLLSGAVRQPNVPVSFLTMQLACYVKFLAGPSSPHHPWQLASFAIMNAIHVSHPSKQMQYVHLWLKGCLLANWAYRARGTGWGSQVTQQGWKLFTQRAQTARTALRSAYQLMPTEPEAGYEMMFVSLELGHPTRILKWFKRTMKADPDNYMACDYMLWAIHRRWYGSAADMREFAKWCIQYGHWRSRIPFNALLAMYTIQRHMQSPFTYNADNGTAFCQYIIEPLLIGHRFWCRPSNWNIVNSAFAGYYKRFPRSTYQLKDFLLTCMWTGHWKELADRLGFYLHNVDDPHEDSVIEQFYFGNRLGGPGYRPLASYHGVMVHPTYMDFWIMSFPRLYREAKLRLASPLTSGPASVYLAKCMAARLAWAAAATGPTTDRGANATASSAAAMREQKLLLAHIGLVRSNERDLMIAYAKQAIHEGCKDPLLLYFELHNIMFIQGTDSLHAQREITAAEQVLRGKYPLDDQFIAAAGAASLPAAYLSPQDRKRSAALLHQAEQLLPRFAANASVPIVVRYKQCQRLWKDLAAKTHSWPTADAALTPRLNKSGAPALLTLILTGWQQKQTALAIKAGPGIAGLKRVPGPLAAKRLNMLNAAHSAFRQAWAMDPNCEPAVNGAWSTRLWINVLTRYFFDLWPYHNTWFIRALNADPYNVNAIRIAAQIEAENLPPYNARNPILHMNGFYLAQLMNDPMYFRSGASPMIMAELYSAQALLSQPTANAGPHPIAGQTMIHWIVFWRHVQPEVTEYLSARPNAERVRSLYTLIACETQHWRTAEQQFSELGDAARVSVFGGRAAYLKFKQKAAKFALQQ